MWRLFLASLEENPAQEENEENLDQGVVSITHQLVIIKTKKIFNPNTLMLMIKTVNLMKLSTLMIIMMIIIIMMMIIIMIIIMIMMMKRKKMIRGIY